ncbi:DUF6234 family protein [Streptomyces sp. NPDC050738]|uniref:DUF6234 family protein n=1 Tax=Streptomyces sp. NPDC050738 TaxID=3154744 RepID=UPI003429D082
MTESLDSPSVGADAASGCLLIFVELLALVVIFILWAVSGWTLDPEANVTADPVWWYLVAVGVLTGLTVLAMILASRRKAKVTGWGQFFMAIGLVLVILAGAAGQVHEDHKKAERACLAQHNGAYCYD